MLGGERPDRIPFFPFARGFCSRTVGYTIGSLYSDPEKSFWSQLCTQEMYDHDETLKFSSACFGAWEFGGEIKFPSGEWEQSISVVRYPVQSEEDVERLAMILRLTRELGVNRSGVEIILRLRHKLEAFQQEMEEMMSVLDDDVKRDFVERFKKIFHED